MADVHFTKRNTHREKKMLNMKTQSSHMTQEKIEDGVDGKKV